MSGICIHNATLLAGYARMERCAVLVDEGRIVDVFSERRFLQKRFDSGMATYDVDGAYVAPGFIDTHIHGFAGFGTEDLSVDAIMAMSDRLGQYGVTTFCPTLYPMSNEDMDAAVLACTGAMGQIGRAHV